MNLFVQVKDKDEEMFCELGEFNSLSLLQLL